MHYIIKIMNNRPLRIFVLTLIIVIFLFASAPKTFASTGFLGGPMWISDNQSSDPEMPEDGDLVYLSALFHNAEPGQLSGNVLFYDSNVLLGNEKITITSGGVSTATVSFKIGAGDHSFSATIGNLTEVLGDGKTEPFVLSPQTVQLPKITVSPRTGSSLNASVVSGSNNITTNNTYITSPSQLPTGSPLAPVVDQVNQLKGNVLDSIPDSVKNPVTSIAQNIDTWRANNAGIINQSTKSSSDLVKKIDTLALSDQKKYGKVSPTTNFIDRPFAYVKLFFYTLLSFLYSHAFVFYLTAVLFVYIVLRFLLRRFVSFRSRGRKNTRVRTRKSKKLIVDN